MSWFIASLIIVVLLVFYPRWTWVSVKKAASMLTANTVFLDVRSKEEFAEDKIPGSLNIPLMDLYKAIEQKKLSKKETTFLYCSSGIYSFLASILLAFYGYHNVHNTGSIYRTKEIIRSATERSHNASLTC